MISLWKQNEKSICSFQCRRFKFRLFSIESAGIFLLFNIQHRTVLMAWCSSNSLNSIELIQLGKSVVFFSYHVEFLPKITSVRYDSSALQRCYLQYSRILCNTDHHNSMSLIRSKISFSLIRIWKKKWKRFFFLSLILAFQSTHILPVPFRFIFFRYFPFTEHRFNLNESYRSDADDLFLFVRQIDRVSY